MTYRKVSIILDKYAAYGLDVIIEANGCSISDAVNAALHAYSLNPQPTMVLDPQPIKDVLHRIVTMTNYGTLENWCNAKSIDIQRLKYLVSSCNKGKTVYGFGNTKNKWRDKQDGREFKTHTAWIAHCLKQDLDIDVT